MGKPNIAILHYSCPPVIGGVESVIESHSKLFLHHGYNLRILVGKGRQFHKNVEFVRMKELCSGSEGYKNQLKAVGRDPRHFREYVSFLARKLENALRGVDICIVHNVMTMHFNIALSWAVKLLADENKKPVFINWVHDHALKDPAYENSCRHETYPCSILTMRQNMKYVAISEQVRQQLMEILKMPEREITVVPNGIDVHAFLRLTPVVSKIFELEKLAEQDIVAFTPSRIVRRKNFELGLEMVRRIKRRGMKIKWLITAAHDPHNPDVPNYLGFLKNMIVEYDLEKNVVFVSRKFNVKLFPKDISCFYHTSDLLLFPSRKEGFGIPLIEAALAKNLAVVSSIPPLEAIGREHVVYIEPEMTDSKALEAATEQILEATSGSSRLQLFKRVLRQYSWRMIFIKNIEPIIKKLREKIGAESF